MADLDALQAAARALRSAGYGPTAARTALTAAEPLIRADERANVRAELLAWADELGDAEHLGGPLIRLTADRIAPEAGSGSQVSGVKL